MIKKKYYFVLAILFFANIICDAELIEYKAEVVKKVKDPNLIYGAGILPHGPQAFTISPDGYIYVADSLARRIVIFDLELNKIREIDMNKNFSAIIGAQQMKVNDEEDILIYSGSEYCKIDKNGNEMPGIYPAFRHIVDDANFVIENDYVFYFDEKKKLAAVNKAGETIKANVASTVRKTHSTPFTDITLDQASEDKLIKYIDANNMIIYDDKVYTYDFASFMKYGDFVKKNLSVPRSSTQDAINPKDYYLGVLLGYDSHSNSYWIGMTKTTSQRMCAVCSKYGEILYAFIYSLDLDKKISFSQALALNGDLYFMYVNAVNDEGVIFYHIKNQWSNK